MIENVTEHYGWDVCFPRGGRDTVHVFCIIGTEATGETAIGVVAEDFLEADEILLEVAIRLVGDENGD
jgi:hypothetical protein